MNVEVPCGEAGVVEWGALQSQLDYSRLQCSLVRFRVHGGGTARTGAGEERERTRRETTLAELRPAGPAGSRLAPWLA